MIDPRFPQDRPLVIVVALLLFGAFVLAVIGAYSLGRYHEYQSAVERMKAAESQAKHWQRR